MHSSFVVYPTPRNLNYWWTFGGILTVMLALQLVTGIVLAMLPATAAGRSRPERHRCPLTVLLVNAGRLRRTAIDRQHFFRLE